MRRLAYNINFVLLSLFVFLSFPLFVFAQLDSKDISNLPQVQELTSPSVSLSLSFSGRVGQMAKIVVSADNFNPNTSDFAWYIDGSKTPSLVGSGKTEFTFKVTKPRQIVRVAVFQEGQKIAENSIVVNAFDVSLAWSTDTYVPADYEGKALPTRGSLISVVALPEIPNYSREDLIYTWYVNGESRLRGVSGAYEFSFRVAESVDYEFVMVEVRNLSGSISLKEAVSIPVVRPSVEIYYTKNLDTKPRNSILVSLKRGDSMFLIAKPYNFRVEKLADLSFIWSYFGKKKVSFDKPYLLKIYADKNSAIGNGTIELEVADRTTQEQRVFKNLQLKIN